MVLTNDIFVVTEISSVVKATTALQEMNNDQSYLQIEESLKSHNADMKLFMIEIYLYCTKADIFGFITIQVISI